MSKPQGDSRARTVWGRYMQLAPARKVIMGVVGAGLSITALLLLEQQEKSAVAPAPFQAMPVRRVPDPAAAPPSEKR